MAPNRIITMGVRVVAAVIAASTVGCASKPAPAPLVIRGETSEGEIGKRLTAEFPIGSTREGVRVRAGELGLMREPVLAYTKMRFGMPEAEEVETDSDVYRVTDELERQWGGAGSVGFRFSAEGRLELILLNEALPVNAPPPGPWGAVLCTGFGGAD